MKAELEREAFVPNVDIGSMLSIWSAGTHPRQPISVDTLLGYLHEGKPNEDNWVVFSTSGVHGSYRTIEDAGYGPSAWVTFLLIRSRTLTFIYGNVAIGSKEDAEKLRRLRTQSHRVIAEIGART